MTTPLQTPGFNTVTPSALPPPPIPTARSAPILQTSSTNQRTQTTLTDLRANTPSDISYLLPSKRHLPATNAYVTAFERFKAMLKGPTPTKQAVYTVENAYLDGHLSHAAFDRGIQQVVTQVHELARRTGEQPNHAHIQGLFRKNGTFPAFSYDYDDPWAEMDYCKQFVSKLLTTRSGQGHSMPLLYKIIAEELGLQARLAFQTVACSNKHTPFVNSGLTNTPKAVHLFTESNSLNCIPTNTTIKQHPPTKGLLVAPNNY